MNTPPRSDRRGSGPSSFGPVRFDQRGSALVSLLLGVLTLGVLVGISLLVLPGDDSSQAVEEAGPSLVDRPSRVERASAAACATEKTTIETAQEAFMLVHGRYAADMNELVAEGSFRQRSQSFEIEGTDSDFEIRPLPGGPCEDGP